MNLQRVVITGMGMVSPLGASVAETAAAIAAGQSGIRRMAGWEEYRGLRCLLAAPAPLMDEKAVPRKMRRSMGRMSFFVVQAAQEALAAAGLEAPVLGSGRTGIAVGSTIGGANAMSAAFESMLPDRDFNNLGSMAFFQFVSHTAAMNLAQFLGCRGMMFSPSAACASGLQAIGLGFDMIRLGTQDVMLCGGAEELHPTVTGSFDVLFAASTHFNDRPEAASRPFDRERDGLVCGEGGGILVLESLEHAQQRGAPILAEVLGYHTCSSGDHVSESNRESMAVCMRQAMANGGVSTANVDYLSAHATGTVHGDREEAAAVREVFGATVPVSSLKGHLGHTLGASGAIELALAIQMLRDGRLQPTRNLTQVDAECAGLNHLQHPLERPMRTVLKNSFAFGGVSCALLCRTWGGEGAGEGGGQ